jgi:murein L,D-transpeptidase YafK
MREALAVKHRKWGRFLWLSTACVASLCLGAFLSYQAAMQTEGLNEAAADANPAVDVARDETASIPAKADLAAAAPAQTVQSSAPAQAQTAAVPAAAPQRPMVLASLESDAPPIFSPSNALASPLELRLDAEPPQASKPPQALEPPQASEPPQSIEALLHDSDLATPSNPQALPPAPEAADPQGLFHGKPAPLPPVRPASLKAPDVALALPVPPVPPGAGPEPVLAPSAPAVPPVANVQPAANPQALAAARPASAAASVAAASSQGSFPSVANALAAVTASVGGMNAAVTPGQPAIATPEVSAEGGFRKGQQAYVRIFKKEGVLELWMKRADNNYALYKSYPVCKWSGQLGPKTRQADYQSPEGFYSVSARQLNPNSHYHLAFDLGYPNAYDRRQGATGSAVMVHGDCKSVGCFAMTNAGIDEIYGIVEAALRNGQHEVPVHIFPFRLTEEAIARESAPKAQFMAFLSTPSQPPQRDWSGFWRNLKQGYDLFERSHVPPVAFACGDRYEFGGAAGSCARIAGW